MNIIGKIWHKGLRKELRQDYLYGIFSIDDGRSFFIVNRNYSDLTKSGNDDRDQRDTIQLNEFQKKKLNELCEPFLHKSSINSSDGYFLYNDSCAPWRNEKCFDSYFNKLHQVRMLLN